MKAIAIAAILSTLLSTAHAQGTLIFNNNNETLVRLSVNAMAVLGTTDVGPTGNAFLAELYYSPAGPDPGDAQMLQGQMGPPAEFSVTLPGRFLGGLRTTPTTTAPGQNAWFQVRVWEAAFGGTYEEAISSGLSVGSPPRRAIAGISNRFVIFTGDPSTGAPGVRLTDSDFRGFEIDLVPEPSILEIGTCLIALMAAYHLAGCFLFPRLNSAGSNQSQAGGHRLPLDISAGQYFTCVSKIILMK